MLHQNQCLLDHRHFENANANRGLDYDFPPNATLTDRLTLICCVNRAFLATLKCHGNHHGVEIVNALDSCLSVLGNVNSCVNASYIHDFCFLVSGFVICEQCHKKIQDYFSEL
ncbi:CLUMA_CG007912, isoform A [Clunio marinus]|uniref:CLUMA_CG007912, isoform A n=1 Tax=Clunio marinus TaxID=568069 RepID=A0A1J1I289_9DIPT|nr:CLUMA_CG007912, isoform A [Clunio marinus]